MDLSLIGIILALIAIEIAFWFWEESKIEGLDKARIDYLSRRIDEFVKSDHSNPLNSGELLKFFNKLITKDEEYILPVGGDFKPHKKIFTLLIISLICSFGYGLITKVLSDFDLTILELKIMNISISHILGLSVLVCSSIAIYIGYKEFRYILDIKKKFKT